MKRKTSKKRKRAKNSLTKEKWLEGALDALAKQGPEVLSIEKLCNHLCVSRGSFYWHFQNREDFINSLINFWSERLIENFTRLAKKFEGGPSEKLLFLAEVIVSTNAGRHDIPIRAWAASNEIAKNAVRKSDQTLYNYVRSLFEELGFKGEDLEMRTRTYVVFYSLETAITIEEIAEERIQRLRKRHPLLTSDIVI